MTAPCIHGFRPEHCAACRPTRASVLTEPHATEEHAGFEIFYVPAVTGWHFRRPDSDPSPLSYRSVFLARKAIDALAAQPSGGGGRTRTAKRSS